MPLRRTLFELFGGVRSLVHKAAVMPQTRDALLVQHEAYRVYTLLLLLIGSGLRPTHQFLSRDALALARGVALVKDKGQRRPLYLHPVIATQLQTYLEYERSFIARLALFDPHESITLKQYLESEGAGKSPLFICHDHSGRWGAVTPAWVKSWLGDRGLFADLYALRRFVRNDLAERKVPQFVLNAFMGHDVRGASAWHLFSPVSYRAIEQALEEPVGLTLRAVGAFAMTLDGQPVGARS